MREILKVRMEKNMRFYIKQHIFTWGDKFSIYGEDSTEKYYVEGEVFTWGK